MFIAQKVISILLCLAGIAVAADPSAVVTDDQRAKALAGLLSSADEAVVNQAMEEIHTLLESNPDESISFCRKYWLPALLAADEFEEADGLAFEGIVAAPWQSAAVESLQETRVRTALQLHHADEALSRARGLLNVATLRGTEHAFLVVVECLKAVHGSDNAMLRQFRKEELAGATTRPATDAPPVDPTLAQISIDPSPYASAISQVISDDDQSQRGKANLLLLAGRSEEALATFQAMHRLSDSSNPMTLAQDVARAMKACDGTIGRANSYMLSEAIVP